MVVLREAAGFTQEEAAKRAGMSVRGLSNLERGLVGRPRRASLDALAEALRLTDRDRRRLFDTYRPAPVPGTEASWRGPRGHLRELIGRQAELAELGAALDRHDLVTVTGPGGCGKTALALAAAGAAHRPVTVLALASLAKPEQVVPALTTTLQIGSADAGLDAIERALSGGCHLLLVDNAEHLAGAVAELVIRLRGGCPGLTVLVTSREPLGLSEELVWRLLPLRTPAVDGDGAAPAAVLFRRRILQALPGADLSDAAAVARVCRRLDGLPLALELAAARVRALPVPQLADRLDRGDDLLTSAVPGPNGPRTLEDTIDWSYRLLDAEEQRALAQLLVFRGRFTPEAVEAVVSVRGNPVAIAAQLVDRSLLQADPAGGYAMLRTIGDYAVSGWPGLGELAATRGRHLDHWLDRGRRSSPMDQGPSRRPAGRRPGTVGPPRRRRARDGRRGRGRPLHRGPAARAHAAGLLEASRPGTSPTARAGSAWWTGSATAARPGCGAGPDAPGPAAVPARRQGRRPRPAAGGAGGRRRAGPGGAPGRAGHAHPGRIRTLDLAAFGRAGQLLAATASCAGDQLAAGLSTVVDIELLYGRAEQAEPVVARVGELVRTSCPGSPAATTASAPSWRRCAVTSRRPGWRWPRRCPPRATSATPAGCGCGWRWPRCCSPSRRGRGDGGARDHPAGRAGRDRAGDAAEGADAAGAHGRGAAPAGRPGAGAALRAGMEAAVADRQPILALAGVLVAAAVRQDAGDRAGAAELAAQWQRVRTGLGLPVPAAYRRTAADLGLDPVAPDPSRARTGRPRAGRRAGPSDPVGFLCRPAARGAGGTCRRRMVHPIRTAGSGPGSPTGTSPAHPRAAPAPHLVTRSGRPAQACARITPP